MDDEEPKPVGSGVFGNIYNQFKGKVKEAFDFLMKHKGGDLLGMFHRKDVGDIDLVWGDENGGLAHILHKHVGEGKSFANVDEAMSHIQNIIETGKNDFEDGGKIVFRKGSELVTVRKNFREGGKKIADKNWILTAYDKEAADNGNRVTTKVIEGKATPHTASTGKGSEKPGKKQEKQSVFDKAKEIADKADKEEKKRKADKPKQKPLTEAERKDAEEVTLKRLAESLRGEKGILARLRDAVARMVEYFKNRGDKEGARRMKAADRLLAEFESALKEGEGVNRSAIEAENEAEERELRDNLVERMRKGGLDVVTDSEEMQRVIDRLNGRGRLSGKQKSALETAMIAAEATNNATVISSADGTILEHLQQIMRIMRARE